MRGGSRVNPIELLRGQHREIEALLRLAEDEGAPQSLEMDSMLRMLRIKLDSHLRLEEEVFYPYVELVVGQEPVADYESEHAALRSVLSELLAARELSSEGFPERLD